MGKQVPQLLSLIVLIQLSSIVVSVSAAIQSADKVIKQAPIVIKTPDGNYDQPNLDDYKSCMKALDSCTAGCHKERECLNKCPKCPILVNEDVVVQGINDTDYKTPMIKALNSTNIIRLTNEIHNVIDNNLGDVIAKNENNLNVYQEKNATQVVNKTCTNNKFGMGCNERGPCCTVISKRQRTIHCGERCQSRVMYARNVVQCTDENDLNSCGHVVEYKPYRPRRMAATATAVKPNRCRYQQKWPFVSCQNQRYQNDCSPICLELAYGYILQHGVPLQCINCYKKLNVGAISASPVGYEPQQLKGADIPNDWNGDDWVLDTERWP